MKDGRFISRFSLRDRREAFSGLLFLKKNAPVTDSQIAWAIPGGFFLSERELDYLRVSLNSPDDRTAIGMLGLKSEKALSNYRTRAIDDGILFQRRIDEKSADVEQGIDSALLHIKAVDGNPDTLFARAINLTLIDRSSEDVLLLFEGVMQRFMKEDMRARLRAAIQNYRSSIASRTLIDSGTLSTQVIEHLGRTIVGSTEITYCHGLDRKSKNFDSDLQLAIMTRGLIWDTLINQLR